MKKLYFLLFVWAIGFTAKAQQKEAIPTTVSFDESKPETINKGRNTLLDKFLQRDYAQVNAVRDSLVKLEDQDYLALYPSENWLILYWTERYNELLAAALNYSQDEIIGLSRKIKPQPDMLFEKLREKSRASSVLLESNIDQSALEPEKKDFLKLQLLNLLADNDYTLIRQETLNQMATDFMQQYPESQYADFTRQYIRYEMVPSKWGFGFEFFSGVGIFTGDLKDNFRTNVPIGVAFDVAYKNWVLYLRDYIGFSTTKEALSFKSGVWGKNETANVYLPEASIGYVLLDERLVKFTPFAGIASTDITPPTGDIQKNETYKDLGLKFTTTYTLGANLDIKLGQPHKVKMVNEGPEQSYWFLRLRYAYNNPQFSKKYNGFDGAMHYITVGIGGFGRKLNRKL